MASVSSGIVHWPPFIGITEGDIVLYDLSIVRDRPSVSCHYRLADVVSALRQDVSEKVSRRFSLSAFSSLFLPPYCALVILRIPASSCVL